MTLVLNIFHITPQTKNIEQNVSNLAIIARVSGEKLEAHHRIRVLCMEKFQVVTVTSRGQHAESLHSSFIQSVVPFFVPFGAFAPCFTKSELLVGLLSVICLNLWHGL